MPFFASQIPPDKNKFSERSRKCIFLGYPHGKKAWKLYDLETGDFFNSRDVVFYENYFPYAPSDFTSSFLSSYDPTHTAAYDDDFLGLHPGAAEMRGVTWCCPRVLMVWILE